MAYDPGYGGGPQQRSYGGPAAQRPAPRGGQYGGAPRQQPPPQQQPQYDSYGDGYGNDNYGGGYQDSYNDHYADQGYQNGYQPHPSQQPQTRRSPPQPNRGGYAPRGGGRPGPGPGSGPGPARGLPQGPGGPGRGMTPGPGPGRQVPGGPGRPGPYSAASDPSANRRPHPDQPPLSPRDPAYQGGRNNGYIQHSQSARSGIGPDRQMMEQMQSMDINGGDPRHAPRQSSESQRSRGEYGRQPMNGQRPQQQGVPQQQGYPEPRRGPPQGQEYGGYDNGYGGGQQGPPANEFGPPGRSMTMPANVQRDMAPPQQRGEPAPFDPYGDASGRAPVPHRPSTSSSHRPPPQAMYGAEQQRPPSDPYGGAGPSYNQNQGYAQSQHRNSYEDPYDAYYGGGGAPDDSFAGGRGAPRSSVPDFDAIPAHQHTGSFEHTMRPALEQQPQAVPQQTPVLGHAKSQPDLRQPQAAVFEMAGDIPSVPPMPPIQQGHEYAPVPNNNGDYNAYNGGYEQPNYQQPPPPPQPVQPYGLPQRGPSAPPGPAGMPAGGHPPVMRPGTAAPQNRNPDGLPSHPTPVRPGLMNNSIVNMNNKPPPVRNYGGLPQAGRGGPPPQQQQQMQGGMQQPMQQVQQPQQQMPQQAAPVVERKPDPVTPQELEKLRQVIKVNPNDQESALRLAKRLIEAADVLVPGLPDAKSRGRARERYITDAHKVLKKLSNAQNPEAMFFHADCLGRGLFGGNESDQKEAFTLYQSAAKMNHAAAAYRTAVCCEIGHEEGGGTRKDPMKAIQWYKRAATLGDPPAMYKVGMILLKGLLGQPRNSREAVVWLKRAAERADADNPHALHELALLFESAQPNDAIVRDERYALDLFQQAAELGYKFSQFRMGCVYEFGLMGCPIDPRLSIMWYSRAATQAEHQAELALSGWYLTGTEGVLGQNDTEAYLWARKAAIAGLAKAEYAMGYFTEVGIGVPANLEDAKRWYWRAAAQDFPKARDRLEDLKRSKTGGGPRARERISRSRIEKQQDGDCVLM